MIGTWKNVRMRCAFRYLFCALVLILTFISIQLALLSEKNLSFVKKNLTFKFGNERNEGHTTSSNKKLVASGKFLPVASTWQEYRSNPNSLCGNPLIDTYGHNDRTRLGENGSGIVLVGTEKEKATQLISQYNVNVYASDRIPLNRMVPDARFAG